MNKLKMAMDLIKNQKELTDAASKVQVILINNKQLLDLYEAIINYLDNKNIDQITLIINGKDQKIEIEKEIVDIQSQQDRINKLLKDFKLEVPK